MNLFKNLFKTKEMSKKNNTPSAPEKELDKELEKALSNTGEKELTQDKLDEAIALFKADNPDGNWEDVDQQTRWDYIDKVFGK